MITLIAGSLFLSILHAIIPNHWLPILAIGKKEQWTLPQTTRVTLIVGLSHAFSTVLIGMALALLGSTLAEALESFTTYVAPAMLITLGVFYIYQHNRHHHFHMHGHPEQVTNKRIIFTLALAMFLSPCFEIEPYFLLAGAQGVWFAALLAVGYTLVTVAGMVTWVRITYKGLLNLNWHAIEHNAGIITGGILILTGVLSFFIQ